MKVAIGTYVSDGNRRSIDVGFAPKYVYVKGNTTQNLAQHAAHSWCKRTVGMNAADSYINGVGIFGDQLHLGTAAEVNTSGARYYWCAIGDDGSDDFDLQSWMGNASAGHVVELAVQKTPIAATVKRDNTLSGVFKFSGVASAAADGTALAECFSALSAGSVTLTAVDNVNQYTVSGFGEGCDGLFIFDGGNARVVSWSAAASGQFIDCGCDPLAAFIVRTDTTGVPTHFVTRDMHDAAPVTNLGIAANTATLQAGGIVLGSASTLRTGTFYALVFGRREGVPARRAPAIIVRDRRGVYLPGRGTIAAVDCGTSDATLKIDGPITIEWYGVQWGDQYAVNFGVHMLERGVGPASTVGAYSWGLAAIQPSDFSWSGPQLSAITTNQWSEVGSALDTCVWRTGIVMPWGRPAHVMTVHDGNGRWRMHLNGKMVKQRRINLATNIVSGAGHRTGFGARRNTADTAWIQAQRQVILSGRVYAAALTQEQCAARFAREALGSSETDVTTGLAEWWDARNASGTSLPASVSSTNNGTISAAGRVITL